MFREIWAWTASTSSIKCGGLKIQPRKIAAARKTTINPRISDDSYTLFPHHQYRERIRDHRPTAATASASTSAAGDGLCGRCRGSFVVGGNDVNVVGLGV